MSAAQLGCLVAAGVVYIFLLLLLAGVAAALSSEDKYDPVAEELNSIAGFGLCFGLLVVASIVFGYVVTRDK